MLSPIQKERLSLLIKDLRDNPKLQGTRALRPNHDSYCCLGRACELSKLDTFQAGIESKYKYEYLGESIGLPVQVGLYYGFPEKEGLSNLQIFPEQVSKGRRSWTLALLNDTEGFTFPMIADIIQYWMENN